MYSNLKDYKWLHQHVSTHTWLLLPFIFCLWKWSALPTLISEAEWPPCGLVSNKSVCDVQPESKVVVTKGQVGQRGLLVWVADMSDVKLNWANNFRGLTSTGRSSLTPIHGHGPWGREETKWSSVCSCAEWEKQEARGCIFLFLLPQIPARRRVRSKHKRMSVTYFQAFAYYSEREEAVLESAGLVRWGGLRRGWSVWQGQDRSARKSPVSAFETPRGRNVHESLWNQVQMQQ